MSIRDFVDKTILQLSDELFHEMRTKLIEDYVTFNVFELKDITKYILAEKLSDYFEKVELYTGKNWGKILEKYASDIDSIVGDRIAKEVKSKKNMPALPVPRARKYYYKAVQIKKDSKMTFQGLVDYSRIMFCLYTAIVKAELMTVDDFDYSMKSLKISNMIDAMKSETVLVGKKLKFDTTNPYDTDRSTFILAILLFYYIKSKEIVGEY